MPQLLQLGVGLDKLNLFRTAAGESKVTERHLVDGEHGCRRTELGAHVSDRGAVSQRNGSHTRTVELYELAHDTVSTKNFRDCQNNVGRRDAGRNRSRELEANNLGDEHRHGLTQHGRLSFDTANAPAQNSQAVDHGGVRVGTDAGVGVCLENSVDLTRHRDARQILNIDLVHDSRSGWHNLEIIERRLAPAKELVALTVAFVLDGHVALEGVCFAVDVSNHRVVDHELCRRERVDALGVAAQS